MMFLTNTYCVHCGREIIADAMQTLPSCPPSTCVSRFFRATTPVFDPPGMRQVGEALHAEQGKGGEW